MHTCACLCVHEGDGYADEWLQEMVHAINRASDKADEYPEAGFPYSWMSKGYLVIQDLGSPTTVRFVFDFCSRIAALPASATWSDVDGEIPADLAIYGKCKRCRPSCLGRYRR